MAHLAASHDRWVRARDLADAADVPFHYLAKLLGHLVHARLLEASRGKSGGYRLARPAEQITLFEVVNTIEPLAAPRQCLLWRRPCDGIQPCSVHDQWSLILEQVHAFLHATTLAQIAQTEGLEIRMDGFVGPPAV